MSIPINQLHNCPACQGPLTVTQLQCRRCDLTLNGTFDSGRFDRLSPEQTAFMETFLRCRGVIRDVEAALGISYPTVRARLDALLTALGYDGPAATQPTAEDTAARRRGILRAIDAGEISAEDGLREWEAMKG